MNLSNLPNLHVLSLCTTINCNAPRNAPRPAVLHDINLVLGAIRGSNKVTNLLFDFTILGPRPLAGFFEQDWVGMFHEVIRIADEKPLELELQMVEAAGILEVGHLGTDKLFVHIMEKAAPLLDYPKICTHFCNPWDRRFGPFPRGQVRSRCMR